MYLVSLGSDPEVFLGDNVGFVSAIDKIGGTKHTPLPMSKPGYFVLEDNVAVEFNIPPATTLQDFVDSIQWSVDEITTEMKKRNLEVKIEPSAMFSHTELADPRAKIFGCEPDYNAWTGRMNPRPHATAKLRSCGGHVHVGFLEHYKGQVDPKTIIKAMDLYLGVPSILMDADERRRQLYGKAGAYRLQPHGVEYRVLSNFWIKSKKLIEWVYTQSHRAFACAMETPHILDTLALDIQSCINNSDANLAQAIVETEKLAIV